ncbi:MAG: hypothetical protein EAZ44_05570 [Cytophagia bacterium]|nr:MAG: hypothetical protein EAY69_12135 [Cytophagales bacterium]TAG03825.1 MAG: hypothetical protein EAZ44_05570 [Cytophagia bacterium]TAG39535.1 MAG: hypothetical protein EAZ31_09135 [Cytophagia bacterium]
MKSIYSLLLVVFLTTLFIGCAAKKDEPGSPGELLLVGKNWKITSLKRDGNEGISSFASCDTDDIYVFGRYGTLARQEGATKCTPTAPDLKVQNIWYLTNGDKNILFGNASTPPITRFPRFYTLPPLVNTTSPAQNPSPTVRIVTQIAEIVPIENWSISTLTSSQITMTYLHDVTRTTTVTTTNPQQPNLPAQVVTTVTKPFTTSLEVTFTAQ